MQQKSRNHGKLEHMYSKNTVLCTVFLLLISSISCVISRGMFEQVKAHEEVEESRAAGGSYRRQAPGAS